jgi:hypothetical protein
VPVCKLSDGFPCTTSDDCASSVCSTSYQDEDGDGYGGTTAVHRCGTQIPPGYAPRADDCCDQDALSSPGATIARNFRNRCGSYDWDCNGIEESQSGGTVK